MASGLRLAPALIDGSSTQLTGWRPPRIVIALLGTTLGLAIGTGFGWAIVTALEGEGISEFHVPVASLGVITLISALAGVAAAILPALARRPPRRTGGDHQRMITRSSRPPAPGFGRAPVRVLDQPSTVTACSHRRANSAEPCAAATCLARSSASPADGSSGSSARNATDRRRCSSASYQRSPLASHSAKPSSAARNASAGAPPIR